MPSIGAGNKSRSRPPDLVAAARPATSCGTDRPFFAGEAKPL